MSQSKLATQYLHFNEKIHKLLSSSIFDINVDVVEGKHD